MANPTIEELHNPAEFQLIAEIEHPHIKSFVLDQLAKGGKLVTVFMIYQIVMMTLGINKIKVEFKDTKGMIIDIRNYPSAFVPFSLETFFSADGNPFVKFSKLNWLTPGEFSFTQTLNIPASTEPYKGKLMVLVNDISQSQAEYTAMAFRAGDNTTIIGSTTAGADGNVSSIMLPGGLRTMISGIGVYYPDGTETQRVGIVPDVEVLPTVKGIKDGRDELLEKAIQLINE